MKAILYPHGGSGNHGCEAIVRSSVQLTGADCVLASSSPEEDFRYHLDTCCRIISDRRQLERFSLRYMSASVKYRLLRDLDAYDRLAFDPLLEAARGCDAALSIGGDNYCYGENSHLYLINRELRKMRIPTVLWCCSVSQGIIEGPMLEDLRGYDRVVARESISFRTLRAAGLKNVELFPDPAFRLDRRQSVIPEGFVDGNTVGINLSPLLLHHENEKGNTLQGIVELIGYILRETDMQVALIPHVVWAHNDDRLPLGGLFDRFKDTGRVLMIEDRPAEEIKDIIARCRFMVAARTHACIAAYSSCVPTLALGYSEKSRGIAMDVMSGDPSFVLDVSDINYPGIIREAFMHLVDRERGIKDHLRTFMPDYTGRLDDLRI